jgi:hypothetical protein
MTPIQKYILILFLLILNTSISWNRNRNPVTYQLSTGSRLWINGSATLGSYECRTVAVYGMGDVDTNDIRRRSFFPETKRINESAHLDVLVRFFDCGNPAMNADMYSALKADKDSVIHYKLLATSVIYDSTIEKGRLGLRTIGFLTIAGKSLLDTIDVDIRILQDKKYEIIGEKTLSMTNFDITPPTAFFGLIRAHENLTVYFDLIAAPNDEKSTNYIIDILENY